MTQSPAFSFKDLSLRTPAPLLATWFGAGLMPKAPGTWGSLAALPFAWVITALWGRPGLFVATVIVFLVGWWAADRMAKTLGLDDPGCVVIDEVAGQWLVLLAAPPGLTVYLAGFLLFRLFDILKPFPVSWADRDVKGGLGIMLDDILAGIYGGLILLILTALWSL
ncbi:MAG: phosphatidylglycerophosphatase A [Telmatospirillum sp.]|nr:phosphatidylglycerophosphatase A [Telmatospirillum sp.]